MKIERHPGPYIGPDCDLAKACAMEVIPWYGNDDGVTHQRIMANGVWNDHISVQTGLAVIHTLRINGLLKDPVLQRDLDGNIAQLIDGRWVIVKERTP